MRDRPQQRGLHEVAAPQRLGLERLPLEPVAVDRDGEQRRERRQEAVPRGDMRVGPCRRVQRADRAVGRLERVRRVPGGGRCAGPSSISRGLDAEDRRRTRRDLVELLVELAPAQQLRRDLGEQRRLLLALLGGAARRRARAASSLTTTAVAK